MTMKKKLLSLLLTLAMTASLCAPALAQGDKYAGIPAGAWYETAAKAAVDSGAMTGTEQGFEPDGAVTRGQIYQIVYNLEGKPAADKSALTDTEGQWYAAAADWAVSVKLFTGETFAGNDAVTRAEVAQIVAGYAALNGIVADQSGMAMQEAPDYASIPAQYLPGMTFCYYTGVMVGDAEQNLTPNAGLTRAQLAQVLVNFAKLTPAYTETKVTVKNEGRDVVAVVTMPTAEGKVPAVVMNHGHGGNKDEGGGFTAVARALALEGIASIRMDFAGCGESTAPFTDESLTSRVSDSNACMEYLVKNYPVDAERLGILGYSMGGRTSALIAGEKDQPYKAMVLLAGAVGDGKTLVEGIAGGTDNYATAYETAKTEGKYTITTQYGQVQDLGQKWFDDMVASKPLENAKSFTGPVLVMYGDKDTVVNTDVNKLSLKAYSNATEVVVKDADHGYGFYSDQPDVTATVEGGIASFFAVSLKDKVSAETFLAAPGRAQWFATGKQAYSITGMTVSKETAVHNKLEDADYTAKPETDVVLTGTSGEQWVAPMEKVLKTYTKEDGSALTAEDFTADKAVKLYTAKSVGNFACFVPVEIKVEVQTAWGDVLQANRDGVPHGKGDYLVCSAGEDGKPDLSDVWVVNGEIFPTTYTMPKA